MSEKDRRAVESALHHLGVLSSHVGHGSLDDPILFDEVCLRLGASIEAVSKASEALRQRAFGPARPAIWSTRNRIAHAYEYIDPQLIRDTIENDVADFEGALRKALADLASEH
ncbi:DUF86 domain-containing protein [Antribacter gilvus]|uniref:HepT-like ribonuclease domain-containing protein n=1 Tax=Antribacter gilvus TaxID=2304675 RepID=UPI000F78546D|nr:HepT-like ribonuclease domain-containing protein [Antribacter gilvus]